MNISTTKLKNVLTEILIKNGATNDEANIISDEILYAEMRGKKSHGLPMLNSMIKRVKNRKDDIIVLNESNQFALIDGNNGIGPVVAKKAMDICVKKTEKYGFAMVAVKNPSHFITPGYPAWITARDKGLIAFCFSVAKSKVAPYGCSEPIFGTNPIGFAFPTKEYPIVVDMSTTNIAAAAIKQALANGKTIPNNVAIDNQGNVTTDPKEALDGSLLTFGGYKGSCISLIIELMAGAFIDAKCGKQNGEMRTMLFFTCRPNLCADESKVRENASNLRNDINTAKSIKNLKGYVPGDNAERLMFEAELNGIELTESDINILKKNGYML